MSEFEKAKQEIMELLESAINDELVCKKLRELKPPAPPKCSSCRHAEFAQDKSHQFCLNTRAGVMNGEFVDDEFGCIQHRDYDKEGEV